MIRSVPRSRLFDALYLGYLVAFFVYLALPLLVTAVFAFNDSPFPSLPWQGFTLDWYLADGSEGVPGCSTMTVCSALSGLAPRSRSGSPWPVWRWVA